MIAVNEGKWGAGNMLLGGGAVRELDTLLAVPDGGGLGAGTSFFANRSAHGVRDGASRDTRPREGHIHTQSYMFS